VSIIGSGNVAQHLAKAFENSSDVELLQVYSRNKSDLQHLPFAAKVTDNPNGLHAADLYVIAVSDSAIRSVAESLPFEGRLVVHTSGSVALSELDAKNRRGVLYPLQTFSKKRKIDFGQVPLCLETEDPNDSVLLEKAARAISGSIFSMDSQQRKAMHVAAVFASNFTNHLYALAADLCEKYSVPFEILQPLIIETASKISELPPLQAQTGPALRNDLPTIDAHLAMLPDDNFKMIYKTLTQSIQQWQKATKN